MTAYYDRPVSLSAALARRIGLFALLLFVVAIVSHRFGSLAVDHFAAIAGLAMLLAIVALLLSIVGFARLWMVGAKGGLASCAALICAAVILAPVAYGFWRFATLPELDEVTSNVSDPPQWLTVVRDEPWMTTFPPVDARDQHAIEAIAYPDLAGRRYQQGFDDVLNATRRAMADNHLAVVSETGVGPPQRATGKTGETPAETQEKAPKSISATSARQNVPIPLDRPSPVLAEPETPTLPRDARIQAIHRSPILGLTSDVVIRLREDGDYVDVDLRVRSRFGPHDLGTGVALMNSVFDALDADLGVSGNN